MVRQSDYTFNTYSSHVISVFDMSSRRIINNFQIENSDSTIKWFECNHTVSALDTV